MHKHWATWLVAGILLVGATGFGSYEYVYSQNTKKAELASVREKESSLAKQKSESESKSTAKAKAKQKTAQQAESTTPTVASSNQELAESSSNNAVEADATSMDVATFIGKYGMTYARYLREHDGMGVEQSLQAATSIGAGMTSGEMQNMYGLEQGRLTETVDHKLVETGSSNDTEDTSYAEKARTPNAEFTLSDGTKIHNDANGDSFDENGQKIGKGD
ncbi:hypothetical protein D3P96_05310 [Weissella viridescens]|uniref:Uncharacterized protein n=1 Tax=Weissella viridescens TaxID=1629 RepID=A0A3P2RAN8_WEIVI|nr:hypothetical protein [Weissella viridescens]RRG17817.1 hypothetical protein D3P96_05310 [Weissella viridescens]